MILDLKKILSCRCPVCTERLYNEITPFSINGGFNFECSLCNADFLSVSKTKTGYSLKVSCFICDTAHEFSVSFDGVWQKKLLSFGCPLTGIDLLYIGDKSNVRNAAHESDNMFSAFDETLTTDECLNELSPLFEEAFKILNNRIISNSIICPCGHTETALKVSPSGITVMCDNCDAKLFIPVSEPNDVKKFNDTDIIKLK